MCHESGLHVVVDALVQWKHLAVTSFPVMRLCIHMNKSTVYFFKSWHRPRHKMPKGNGVTRSEGIEDAGMGLDGRTER